MVHIEFSKYAHISFSMAIIDSVTPFLSIAPNIFALIHFSNRKLIHHIQTCINLNSFFCILIEFNVKRHQCGPTFYHFIVCMAQHWCLLRERERGLYARQTIMVQQSDWTFDWHIWQWCENKRSQKWLKEPNSFIRTAFCLQFQWHRCAKTMWWR